MPLHASTIPSAPSRRASLSRTPRCPLGGRFTAPPNSSHRPTAGAGAPSEVERGEEPERVVGESDLFEAEGSPELQHLVEGNAEDEFDVGLCGLIEQRRQNQSNASGP